MSGILIAPGQPAPEPEPDPELVALRTFAEEVRRAQAKLEAALAEGASS